MAIRLPAVRPVSRRVRLSCGDRDFTGPTVRYRHRSPAAHRCGGLHNPTIDAMLGLCTPLKLNPNNHKQLLDYNRF